MTARLTLSPLFLVMLLIAISGCSGAPETGPVDVKWDRDVCDRCRMVLSDRLHSAQIRGGAAGQKRKVYKFDDFGCAVLWLDGQPWKSDPTIEIWVNDHRTGGWIDARTAYYVTGHETPMQYSLGAQAAAGEGTMGYAEAAEFVRQTEQKFNTHGVHLEQSASERDKH